MRFACLTTVAPGSSLAARCAAIAAAGCAGVETLVFPDTPLAAWQAELRRATADAGVPLVGVILGGLALHRADALPWVREVLPAIAELGAAALLTPEYRGQDPPPLFPPYTQPPPDEQAQVDAALAEISRIAEHLALPVWFEPVTPFESRFWRDTATVLAVCERLGNPYVGLVLDFHNMNITEAGLGQTIRRAGAWIRHIHLADNNRRLPGCGHIDFSGGLAALRATGYSGWYSFECAVDGDFVPMLRRVMNDLRHMQEE